MSSPDGPDNAYFIPLGANANILLAYLTLVTLFARIVQGIRPSEHFGESYNTKGRGTWLGSI